MALPAAIRRLMTQTVQWEAFESADSYSDETYAAPVALQCHVELAEEMQRPPDETRQVPTFDLYFDGGDSRVQSFTLRDRFTVTGVGQSQDAPLQPRAIDPIYGPPPGGTWVVRVTLG